jgi:hypothetical protein
MRGAEGWLLQALRETCSDKAHIEAAPLAWLLDYADRLVEAGTITSERAQRLVEPTRHDRSDA